MAKSASANHRPAGHPPVKSGGIGILLINLGTPEGTSYGEMRRYLKEFLSDRRVIEVNPVVWWFVLNGIILNTRPQRSGHAYDKIWNRERNESPLKTITRAQAEKVAARFAKTPAISVDWAMRYGKPSIGERLARMKEEGCERILLFPLYPQYSAATTATALDSAYDALKKMRWQPAIRTVPPYYDAPAHIDAVAQSPVARAGVRSNFSVQRSPIFCSSVRVTSMSARVPVALSAASELEKNRSTKPSRSLAAVRNFVSTEPGDASDSNEIDALHDSRPLADVLTPFVLRTVVSIIFESSSTMTSPTASTSVHVGDDADPAKLQPEQLRDACVLHGSPETVARKILALRDEIGDFGTLLYAAHDWQDKARMKHSLRLMAQEVMPRVNAALRDKAA